MIREASPTRCPPMPQTLAYTHSRNTATRRRVSTSLTSAGVNSFCRVLADGTSDGARSVMVAVASSGGSTAALATSDGGSSADSPTGERGVFGVDAGTINGTINILHRPEPNPAESTMRTGFELFTSTMPACLGRSAPGLLS